MFGKKQKQVTVEIDYAILAQEVAKIQMEKLQSLDDATTKHLFANALAFAEEHLKKKKAEQRTPIGRVSEELLKDYQEHNDEANGLEQLISDVLKRKAMLARQRKALWNGIEVELGVSLDNARIDLKTGDIYYLETEEEGQE